MKSTTTPEPEYSNEEYLYDYEAEMAEITLSQNIYRSSYDVNVVFQFLTIFANIFHLIILFQKELRKTSIFILMIGICLADISGFLVAFYDQGISRNWFDMTSSIWKLLTPAFLYSSCISYDYIVIDVAHTLKVLVQMASRPVSIWLAILMAGIRTLSVIFPMSSWIQKLSHWKSAILMTIVVCVFWTIYYSWELIFIERLWFADHTNGMCPIYYLGPIPNDTIFAFHLKHYHIIQTRERLEYIIRLVPTSLYPILSIFLFIELRKIRKRREKMNKNEKSSSDNTTKLILFMTVSFMLSEGLSGILTIMSLTIPDSDKYGEFDWRGWIAVAQAVVNNLRSLNALSHFFVCFAMSSQYRDTVKRICCFCRPIDKMVTFL
uniref:Protein kinase domain-containing protein n=1 Tax=Caenorhabditis tropicalis TaxID=1561998 RepID=A0A1I7UWM9_9PELO